MVGGTSIKVPVVLSELFKLHGLKLCRQRPAGPNHYCRGW